MKLKVISQYHPAAALHQPRLWATLLDDWAHLPTSVPHDFTVTDALPPLGTTIALDTETDNQGGIGRWSIAWRDPDSKQLLVHSFYGAQKGFPTDKYTVLGHNLKYDNRELVANGMLAPSPIHQRDTMIEAYCLGLGKQAPKEEGKNKSGSDMVGGLGLKYLIRRHLGMQQMTWAEVKDHPEIQPEYNAKDSVGTYLLDELWIPTMPKHFFDIDMPLLPVLMALEDRGVMIDPDYLTELGKELDNRLATFDEQAAHLAYHNKEMQKYLYETLGLKPWKFTDTKQPSVDIEVLEVIDDPVVKRVIEYKSLFKEKGTYVESYINGADAHNRIHPEFKQTSTSTGRLSCARPNLQNVFKRDDRVKLRALFVAPAGKKLIRADFNQLDYRALAAITQDPILIKALNANKKIHQVTADEMNLKYDDAKTVNFGVLFGQEAWALSSQLHISINEARDFMKRYFERFPNIKKYRDQMTEIAKRDKKVTIPFTNRSRRIDAMFVDQWKVQNEGIKEAINMPVQGLEAEVVKIVMNDLHYKHSCPMELQIHDELIIEVDDKDALEYAHWVKDYIPTVVEFGGMKFPVSVGIGQNWYEAMNNEI